MRNDLFAPVEVELRLQRLANVQGGSAPRIVRRVVPPRSTQVLTVLAALPGERVKYDSKLRYALGDPRGAHRRFAIRSPGKEGRSG